MSRSRTKQVRESRRVVEHCPGAIDLREPVLHQTFVQVIPGRFDHGAIHPPKRRMAQRGPSASPDDEKSAARRLP